MAEFVGGEPISVGVDEPVTFENKTDTAFDVDCGIVFRKSGLYRVSIVGRHITVAVEPESKLRGWIPCSDPSDLPKDKRLWITREISDGFFTLREVSDVIWDMTEWSGSVSNVVAYMPYWEPEPYKERRPK